MMNTFKVGLLGGIVSAVLVTPAGPVRAQAYRCVDKGGEVHLGQGTPPAWCQADTMTVPKALLDRPVTPKEVEDIKEYLNQKLEDAAQRKETCRDLHGRIEEAKDDS